VCLQKPFSSSSEENKDVILQTIQPLLLNKNSVLEIASGTGQHAVYFAQHLPNLQWQTSDLRESHTGIQQWLADAQLSNVLPPIALDVSKDSWPKQTYDAIFSANSFHIMNSQNVADLFSHIHATINPSGLVIIYGPFNYQGRFTSDSNQRFDLWLKGNNPESGIKDFEWCNQLAENAGFKLVHDFEMPQNNRILCWQKQETDA